MFKIKFCPPSFFWHIFVPTMLLGAFFLPVRKKCGHPCSTPTPCLFFINYICWHFFCVCFSELKFKWRLLKIGTRGGFPGNSKQTKEVKTITKKQKKYIFLLMKLYNLLADYIGDLSRVPLNNPQLWLSTKTTSSKIGKTQILEKILNYWNTEFNLLRC